MHNNQQRNLRCCKMALQSRIHWKWKYVFRISLVFSSQIVESEARQACIKVCYGSSRLNLKEHRLLLIWNSIKADSTCRNWGEENGRRSSKNWTDRSIIFIINGASKSCNTHILACGRYKTMWKMVGCWRRQRLTPRTTRVFSNFFEKHSFGTYVSNRSGPT